MRPFISRYWILWLFLRWRPRVGHCIPNEVFVAFQQLLHVKINQSLFKKICSLRLEIDISTGFIPLLLNYFSIFSYRIKKAKVWSERGVIKKSLKPISVFVSVLPFVPACTKMYTFGFSLEIWNSFLKKFSIRVNQRRCCHNYFFSNFVTKLSRSIFLKAVTHI